MTYEAPTNGSLAAWREHEDWVRNVHGRYRRMAIERERRRKKRIARRRRSRRTS